MEKENLTFFNPVDKCPVRDVLSRLGEKWPMLVLVTLEANGTMRFSELIRAIGDISQRMLTVTLRTLETDGLVVRKVYPQVPPRVDYALTDLGRSLIPCVTVLVNWAVKNMDAILDNRKNTGVAGDLHRA